MRERDLLLAAFAEAVFEDGYTETTPASIAARADLDILAFDAHFTSIEDCLIAAYESITERAFSIAYMRYVDAPGGWAPGVHEALRGLLAFFADHPASTHLWAIESHHAGGRLVEHRNDAIRRVIELLEPGFSSPAKDDPPPRAVAEMVGGGLFELIRLHAANDRSHLLPEALPVATMIALSPFLGRTEARRIAKSD